MNTLKQTTILSLRLGRRAIKQRSKILLCACIFMCTFIASCLNLFASSVQNALNNDIANYLGAPLVVRSSGPLQELSPLLSTLKMAQPVITHSITTGAISAQSYQSISLKGVSQGYPLQGQLLVTNNLGQQTLYKNKLKQGEALVDSRTLDELQLSLGDSFQVGRTQLIVHGILDFEPDRLTQLQHALPRVLVSIQTLALSGVAEGANKGEFRTLFAGDEAAISRLEQALPTILSPHQSILKPNAGHHPFSRISLRAEKMLSVLLVLILIMCGSAAASLADHSVKHYIQTATVLRCMGVNRNAVVLALLLQLTLLAILSSLLASISAWLIQPSFAHIMQPHMQLLPSSFAWSVFTQPLVIALVTILVFVAPKLRALSTFPVSHVLRGITPRQSVNLLSLVLISLLSIGLLYLNSDNLKLTIMMVAAVASLILLSLVFAWCLSKLCAHTHHLFKGTSKVAIRSIGRSPQRHFASLLSISIAMMAILMTMTLRGNFIDLLQVQTIEQDGNYIYTGLSSASKKRFIDTLKENSGELKSMHPTVNARLVMVNGVATEEALNSESDTREEARSKVRLSWAVDKPNNNKLLEGKWPKIGSNEVSVEAEVMSDLGLSIGDVLSFKIGDTILNSRISSTREFQVADSRVMFWFMFAPDALANFEHTMMGGFNLNDSGFNNSPESSKPILGILVTQFPSVKITNLERQISTIRTTMIALTRLMNTALLLLLGGALMLIISSSFSNAVNRQSQNVLLRAFGLQNQQLLKMNLIEHFTLSAVACAVGILGVQLIGSLMFKELFAMNYQLDWARALTLSAYIITGFVILGGLFSFRSSQQTVRLSMQS